MDIEALIGKILDLANVVREQLAPGYYEDLYEKALMIELENAEIKAKSQYPITVYYNQKPIGEYKADIFVEDKVLIELKAVSNITPTHEAQLVNYLTATGIDNGLLINFGNEEKIQIKRKYRIYRPKGSYNRQNRR